MQYQTVSRPVSLVCAAAPADTALLAQWETHLLPLQQAGLLTCWSERHLQAGDDRQKQFSAHLAQAECIVLLLSADFFADNDCITLMHEALLRLQTDPLRILPLLIRPVAWQDSPLGTLLCLPANGVAITTWEHPDAGWQSAVQGLRRLLGLGQPPSAFLARADKATRTDRERMLRLLHRTYQASLDGSLQGVAWMELDLAEHSDAVRNATHLLQRLPDRTERILAAGTSILNAYDQAEEELLILGAPGAGKSTLLLHLALDLLRRAEADATHPLPVVVPLSSWAIRRQPIADWLVEQLACIYDVPRALGQVWSTLGQVLPLLDGLDEMEENARPLCIAAINAYQTQRVAPLVVCSRQAEYEAAATPERLHLQNAVVVQALTQEQAENMIRAGSFGLAGLHTAFTEQSTLRELATTPLMLSVLMLAYRGMTIDDLPQQQGALEARVWTDYVERMVRTKGAERQERAGLPEKRYSLAQTTSWLSWLAQQMQTHNQTLFYGEYLQESWLPASQQRVGRWLLVRPPAILLGIVTSLLCSFFVGATFPSALGLLDATSRPSFLYQIGLAGGFLGWCLSRDQTVVIPSPSRWKHVRQGSLPRLLHVIVLGFLAAVSFGLDLSPYDYSKYSIGDWLRDGVCLGICLSVSFWLLETHFMRINSLSPPPPRPMSRRSRIFGWMRMLPGRRAMWAGMLLGIGFGLSYGLSVWLTELSYRLSYGLSWGPRWGLSAGLSAGLIYGLSLGGTTFLVSSLLETRAGMVHLAERLQWARRSLFQWHHLRTSLLIAIAGCCLFGLSEGLSFGVGSGLFIGLSFGLSIGLSVGLSVGLSYWALVGLYQGITQHHLEDQDRRRFHQGLHRSLRNGLLLSLLSAGIITGLTIGLSSELSYGLGYGLSYGLGTSLNVGLSVGLSDGQRALSDGLREGLSVGLSHWWLVALCGWLVVWAATGGLALLRHSLLRLLLARSRTFPWQARAFLDDATARVLLRRVGGGYGFMHRRLLDYFADAALVPDDTSEAAQQAPSEPQSLSGSLPGAATSEGL